MSQPHAPRPEDQPAQQPRDAQEPRTQSIPVIAPDGSLGATAAPAPGPAFLTDAGWPAVQPTPAAPPVPPTPPVGQAPSPGPATAPPVPPAQMPPPAFPPQPAPPPQVWPQPVVPAPSAEAPREVDDPSPLTGPGDFVPGFGTPATAPPPGSAATATSELPAAGSSARRAGRGLGARLTGRVRGGAAGQVTRFAGVGAGVLGLLLLELGLGLAYGTASLWSLLPTWSAFATVAAVVALLPLAARWLPSTPDASTLWQITLAGAAGLAAFWVLVALPAAASDRGFLLTAGPAMIGAALWLAPERKAAGRAGTDGTGGSAA